MAIDYNIRQQGGIGGVLSVRAWTYPGPIAYPQPPAAMPAGEVPPDEAHFFVYEAFPQRNQGGASMGRGSTDTGSRTVFDYFQSQGTTTQERIENLLISLFGSTDS